MADQCHYITDRQSPSSTSDTNSPLGTRKLEAEDELAAVETAVEGVADDEAVFKAMGYMLVSLVFNLSKRVEVYGLASPN